MTMIAIVEFDLISLGVHEQDIPYLSLADLFFPLFFSSLQAKTNFIMA